MAPGHRMDSSDAVLVAGMLAGNQRAFTAFFNAYKARLTAFAIRRSKLPMAVIDDVVQSTLIKAMRNLANFRAESALGTWLCGICWRELVDAHRKLSHCAEWGSAELGQIPEEDMLASEDAEPQLAVDATLHRNLIEKIMRELPKSYAWALELKYGEGRSVKEIATILEISTVAAQSLLARARSAFKVTWLQEQSPL